MEFRAAFSEMSMYGGGVNQIGLAPKRVIGTGAHFRLIFPADLVFEFCRHFGDLKHHDSQ